MLVVDAAIVTIVLSAVVTAAFIFLTYTLHFLTPIALAYIARGMINAVFRIKHSMSFVTIQFLRISFIHRRIHLQNVTFNTPTFSVTIGEMYIQFAFFLRNRAAIISKVSAFVADNLSKPPSQVGILKLPLSVQIAGMEIHVYSRSRKAKHEAVDATGAAATTEGVATAATGAAGAGGATEHAGRRKHASFHERVRDFAGVKTAADLQKLSRAEIEGFIKSLKPGSVPLLFTFFPALSFSVRAFRIVVSNPWARIGARISLHDCHGAMAALDANTRRDPYKLQLEAVFKSFRVDLFENEAFNPFIRFDRIKHESLLDDMLEQPDGQPGGQPGAGPGAGQGGPRAEPPEDGGHEPRTLANTLRTVPHRNYLACFQKCRNTLTVALLAADVARISLEKEVGGADLNRIILQDKRPRTFRPGADAATTPLCKAPLSPTENPSAAGAGPGAVPLAPCPLRDDAYPAFSILLRLEDNVVANYSPWLERERRRIFATFFPQTLADAPVTLSVADGKPFVRTALGLYMAVVFDTRAELHFCFRNGDMPYDAVRDDLLLSWKAAQHARQLIIDEIRRLQDSLNTLSATIVESALPKKREPLTLPLARAPASGPVGVGERYRQGALDPRGQPSGSLLSSMILPTRLPDSARMIVSLPKLPLLAAGDPSEPSESQRREGRLPDASFWPDVPLRPSRGEGSSSCSEPTLARQLSIQQAPTQQLVVGPPRVAPGGGSDPSPSIPRLQLPPSSFPGKPLDSVGEEDDKAAPRPPLTIDACLNSDVLPPQPMGTAWGARSVVRRVPPRRTEAPLGPSRQSVPADRGGEPLRRTLTVQARGYKEALRERRAMLASSHLTDSEESPAAGGRHLVTESPQEYSFGKIMFGTAHKRGRSDTMSLFKQDITDTSRSVRQPVIDQPDTDEAKDQTENSTATSTITAPVRQRSSFWRRSALINEEELAQISTEVGAQQDETNRVERGVRAFLYKIVGNALPFLRKFVKDSFSKGERVYNGYALSAFDEQTESLTVSIRRRMLATGASAGRLYADDVAYEILRGVEETLKQDTVREATKIPPPTLYTYSSRKGCFKCLADPGLSVAIRYPWTRFDETSLFTIRIAAPYLSIVCGSLHQEVVVADNVSFVISREISGVHCDSPLLWNIGLFGTNIRLELSGLLLDQMMQMTADMVASDPELFEYYRSAGIPLLTQHVEPSIAFAPSETNFILAFANYEVGVCVAMDNSIDYLCDISAMKPVHEFLYNKYGMAKMLLDFNSELSAGQGSGLPRADSYSANRASDSQDPASCRQFLEEFHYIQKPLCLAEYRREDRNPFQAYYEYLVGRAPAADLAATVQACTCEHMYARYRALSKLLSRSRDAPFDDVTYRFNASGLQFSPVYLAPTAPSLVADASMKRKHFGPKRRVAKHSKHNERAKKAKPAKSPRGKRNKWLKLHSASKKPLLFPDVTRAKTPRHTAAPSTLLQHVRGPGPQNAQLTDDGKVAASKERLGTWPGLPAASDSTVFTSSINEGTCAGAILDFDSYVVSQNYSICSYPRLIIQGNFFELAIHSAQQEFFDGDESCSSTLPPSPLTPFSSLRIAIILPDLLMFTMAAQQSVFSSFIRAAATGAARRKTKESARNPALLRQELRILYVDRLVIDISYSAPLCKAAPGAAGICGITTSPCAPPGANNLQSQESLPNVVVVDLLLSSMTVCMNGHSLALIIRFIDNLFLAQKYAIGNSTYQTLPYGTEYQNNVFYAYSKHWTLMRLAKQFTTMFKGSDTAILSEDALRAKFLALIPRINLSFNLRAENCDVLLPTNEFAELPVMHSFPYALMERHIYSLGSTLFAPSQMVYGHLSEAYFTVAATQHSNIMTCAASPLRLFFSPKGYFRHIGSLTSDPRSAAGCGTNSRSGTRLARYLREWCEPQTLGSASNMPVAAKGHGPHSKDTGDFTLGNFGMKIAMYYVPQELFTRVYRSAYDFSSPQISGGLSTSDLLSFIAAVMTLVTTLLENPMDATVLDIRQTYQQNGEHILERILRLIDACDGFDRAFGQDAFFDVSNPLKACKTIACRIPLNPSPAKHPKRAGKASLPPSLSGSNVQKSPNTVADKTEHQETEILGSTLSTEILHNDAKISSPAAPQKPGMPVESLRNLESIKSPRKADGSLIVPPLVFEESTLHQSFSSVDEDDSPISPLAGDHSRLEYLRYLTQREIFFYRAHTYTFDVRVGSLDISVIGNTALLDKHSGNVCLHLKADGVKYEATNACIGDHRLRMSTTIQGLEVSIQEAYKNWDPTFMLRTALTFDFDFLGGNTAYKASQQQHIIDAIRYTSFGGNALADTVPGSLCVCPVTAANYKRVRRFNKVVTLCDSQFDFAQAARSIVNAREKALDTDMELDRLFPLTERIRNAIFVAVPNAEKRLQEYRFREIMYRNFCEHETPDNGVEVSSSMESIISTPSGSDDLLDARISSSAYDHIRTAAKQEHSFNADPLQLHAASSSHPLRRNTSHAHPFGSYSSYTYHDNSVAPNVSARHVIDGMMPGSCAYLCGVDSRYAEVYEQVALSLLKTTRCSAPDPWAASFAANNGSVYSLEGACPVLIDLYTEYLEQNTIAFGESLYPASSVHVNEKVYIIELEHFLRVSLINIVKQHDGCASAPTALASFLWCRRRGVLATSQILENLAEPIACVYTESRDKSDDKMKDAASMPSSQQKLLLPCGQNSNNIQVLPFPVDTPRAKPQKIVAESRLLCSKLLWSISLPPRFLDPQVLFPISDAHHPELTDLTFTRKRRHSLTASALLDAPPLGHASAPNRSTVMTASANQDLYSCYKIVNVSQRQARVKKHFSFCLERGLDIAMQPTAVVGIADLVTSVLLAAPATLEHIYAVYRLKRPHKLEYMNELLSLERNLRALTNVVYTDLAARQWSFRAAQGEPLSATPVGASQGSVKAEDYKATQSIRNLHNLLSFYTTLPNSAISQVLQGHDTPRDTVADATQGTSGLTHQSRNFISESFSHLPSTIVHHRSKNIEVPGLCTTPLTGRAFPRIYAPMVLPIAPKTIRITQPSPRKMDNVIDARRSHDNSAMESSDSQVLPKKSVRQNPRTAASTYVTTLERILQLREKLALLGLLDMPTDKVLSSLNIAKTDIEGRLVDVTRHFGLFPELQSTAFFEHVVPDCVHLGHSEVLFNVQSSAPIVISIMDSCSYLRDGASSNLSHSVMTLSTIKSRTSSQLLHRDTECPQPDILSHVVNTGVFSQTTKQTTAMLVGSVQRPKLQILITAPSFRFHTGSDVFGIRFNAVASLMNFKGRFCKLRNSYRFALQNELELVAFFKNLCVTTDAELYASLFLPQLLDLRAGTSLQPCGCSTFISSDAIKHAHTQDSGATSDIISPSYLCVQSLHLSLFSRCRNPHGCLITAADDAGNADAATEANAPARSFLNTDYRRKQGIVIVKASSVHSNVTLADVKDISPLAYELTLALASGRKIADARKATHDAIMKSFVDHLDFVRPFLTNDIPEQPLVSVLARSGSALANPEPEARQDDTVIFAKSFYSYIFESHYTHASHAEFFSYLYNNSLDLHKRTVRQQHDSFSDYQETTLLRDVSTNRSCSTHDNASPGTERIGSHLTKFLHRMLIQPQDGEALKPGSPSDNEVQEGFSMPPDVSARVPTLDIPGVSLERQDIPSCETFTPRSAHIPTSARGIKALVRQAKTLRVIPDKLIPLKVLNNLLEDLIWNSLPLSSAASMTNSEFQDYAILYNSMVFPANEKVVCDFVQAELPFQANQALRKSFNEHVDISDKNDLSFGVGAITVTFDQRIRPCTCITPEHPTSISSQVTASQEATDRSHTAFKASHGRRFSTVNRYPQGYLDIIKVFSKEESATTGNVSVHVDSESERYMQQDAHETVLSVGAINAGLKTSKTSLQLSFSNDSFIINISPFLSALRYFSHLNTYSVTTDAGSSQMNFERLSGVLSVYYSDMPTMLWNDSSLLTYVISVGASASFDGSVVTEETDTASQDYSLDADARRATSFSSHSLGDSSDEHSMFRAAVAALPPTALPTGNLNTGNNLDQNTPNPSPAVLSSPAPNLQQQKIMDNERRARVTELYGMLHCLPVTLATKIKTYLSEKHIAVSASFKNIALCVLSFGCCDSVSFYYSVTCPLMSLTTDCDRQSLKVTTKLSIGNISLVKMLRPIETSGASSMQDTANNSQNADLFNSYNQEQPILELEHLSRQLLSIDGLGVEYTLELNEWFAFFASTETNKLAPLTKHTVNVPPDIDLKDVIATLTVRLGRILFAANQPEEDVIEFLTFLRSFKENKCMYLLRVTDRLRCAQNHHLRIVINKKFFSGTASIESPALLDHGLMHHADVRALDPKLKRLKLLRNLLALRVAVSLSIKKLTISAIFSDIVAISYCLENLSVQLLSTGHNTAKLLSMFTAIDAQSECQCFRDNDTTFDSQLEDLRQLARKQKQIGASDALVHQEPCAMIVMFLPGHMLEFQATVSKDTLRLPRIQASIKLQHEKLFAIQNARIHLLLKCKILTQTMNISSNAINALKSLRYNVATLTTFLQEYTSRPCSTVPEQFSVRKPEEKKLPAPSIAPLLIFSGEFLLEPVQLNILTPEVIVSATLGVSTFSYCNDDLDRDAVGFYSSSQTAMAHHFELNIHELRLNLMLLSPSIDFATVHGLPSARKRYGSDNPTLLSSNSIADAAYRNSAELESLSTSFTRTCLDACVFLCDDNFGMKKVFRDNCVLTNVSLSIYFSLHISGQPSVHDLSTVYDLSLTVAGAAIHTHRSLIIQASYFIQALVYDPGASRPENTFYKRKEPRKGPLSSEAIFTTDNTTPRGLLSSGISVHVAVSGFDASFLTDHGSKFSLTGDFDVTGKRQLVSSSNSQMKVSLLAQTANLRVTVLAMTKYRRVAEEPSMEQARSEDLLNQTLLQMTMSVHPEELSAISSENTEACESTESLAHSSDTLSKNAPLTSHIVLGDDTRMEQTSQSSSILQQSIDGSEDTCEQGSVHQMEIPETVTFMDVLLFQAEYPDVETGNIVDLSFSAGVAIESKTDTVAISATIRIRKAMIRVNETFLPHTLHFVTAVSEAHDHLKRHNSIAIMRSSKGERLRCSSKPDDTSSLAADATHNGSLSKSAPDAAVSNVIELLVPTRTVFTGSFTADNTGLEIYEYSRIQEQLDSIAKALEQDVQQFLRTSVLSQRFAGPSVGKNTATPSHISCLMESLYPLAHAALPSSSLPKLGGVATETIPGAVSDPLDQESIAALKTLHSMQQLARINFGDAQTSNAAYPTEVPKAGRGHRRAASALDTQIASRIGLTSVSLNDTMRSRRTNTSQKTVGLAATLQKPDPPAGPNIGYQKRTMRFGIPSADEQNSQVAESFAPQKRLEPTVSIRIPTITADVSLTVTPDRDTARYSLEAVRTKRPDIFCQLHSLANRTIYVAVAKTISCIANIVIKRNIYLLPPDIFRCAALFLNQWGAYIDDIVKSMSASAEQTPPLLGSMTAQEPQSMRTAALNGALSSSTTQYKTDSGDILPSSAKSGTSGTVPSSLSAASQWSSNTGGQASLEKDEASVAVSNVKKALFEDVSSVLKIIREETNRSPLNLVHGLFGNDVSCNLSAKLERQKLFIDSVTRSTSTTQENSGFLSFVELSIQDTSLGMMVSTGARVAARHSGMSFQFVCAGVTAKVVPHKVRSAAVAYKRITDTTVDFAIPINLIIGAIELSGGNSTRETDTATEKKQDIKFIIGSVKAVASFVGFRNLSSVWTIWAYNLDRILGAASFQFFEKELESKKQRGTLFGKKRSNRVLGKDVQLPEVCCALGPGQSGTPEPPVVAMSSKASFTLQSVDFSLYDGTYHDLPEVSLVYVAQLRANEARSRDHASFGTTPKQGAQAPEKLSISELDDVTLAVILQLQLLKQAQQASNPRIIVTNKHPVKPEILPLSLSYMRSNAQQVAEFSLPSLHVTMNVSVVSHCLLDGLSARCSVEQMTNSAHQVSIVSASARLDHLTLRVFENVELTMLQLDTIIAGLDCTHYPAGPAGAVSGRSSNKAQFLIENMDFSVGVQTISSLLRGWEDLQTATLSAWREGNLTADGIKGFNDNLLHTRKYLSRKERERLKPSTQQEADLEVDLSTLSVHKKDRTLDFSSNKILRLYASGCNLLVQIRLDRIRCNVAQRTLVDQNWVTASVVGFSIVFRVRPKNPDEASTMLPDSSDILTAPLRAQVGSSMLPTKSMYSLQSAVNVSLQPTVNDASCCAMEYPLKDLSTGKVYGTKPSISLSIELKGLEILYCTRKQGDNPDVKALSYVYNNSIYPYFSALLSDQARFMASSVLALTDLRHKIRLESFVVFLRMVADTPLFQQYIVGKADTAPGSVKSGTTSIYQTADFINAILKEIIAFKRSVHIEGRAAVGFTKRGLSADAAAFLSDMMIGMAGKASETQPEQGEDDNDQKLIVPDGTVKVFDRKGECYIVSKLALENLNNLLPNMDVLGKGSGMIESIIRTAVQSDQYIHKGLVALISFGCAVNDKLSQLIHAAPNKLFNTK